MARQLESSRTPNLADVTGSNIPDTEVGAYTQKLLETVFRKSARERSITRLGRLEALSILLIHSLCCGTRNCSDSMFILQKRTHRVYRIHVSYSDLFSSKYCSGLGRRNAHELLSSNRASGRSWVTDLV